MVPTWLRTREPFVTRRAASPLSHKRFVEAELKLEHTRILSVRNPHAPDNLITFDFNAMNFTPGPAIEHMETNYKRMVSIAIRIGYTV